MPATTLHGTVDMVEGRDAIHRDLDRLEGCTYVKFNKTRCKVLHLNEGNPEHKYRAENGLRAALRKRNWVCWLMTNST